MTTETGIRAHHFTVGALACAIVSDGSFVYDDPASLWFANAPQTERDSALRAYGIDAETWHEYVSPYSALLIDTGQQAILVDTGAGGFAPTNGHLLDNLRAEGVDPATIDTVVLTHAHPDHIGGNPMNVHHPEWYAAFDLQPDQAIATRSQLLNWAADEDMLLHGAHFPWPGLGRVRREDAGLRWQPLDQPKTHPEKE